MGKSGVGTAGEHDEPPHFPLPVRHSPMFPTNTAFKPGRTAGARRGGNTMLKKLLAAALAAAGVTALAAPLLADGEQFLPALVYRTGPYAPNGIPFADGVTDYWTLVN